MSEFKIAELHLFDGSVLRFDGYFSSFRAEEQYTFGGHKVRLLRARGNDLAFILDASEIEQIVYKPEERF